MSVNRFLGRIGRALARSEAPGPPRLEVLWPLPPGAPGRVALVPGSFDPMTIGHAALAEALLHRADLVLFVYSPRTLPKEPGPGGEAVSPLLPPADRLASLLAHARAHPGMGVALCSHGLYVDQAEAARRAFPEAELTFGVGSDKVSQLFDPNWYEDRDTVLDRLFSLARIAYAARQGQEGRLEEALPEVLAEAGRWAGRLEALELPPEVSGVSSREVREALRRGRDVRGLVPPQVVPFLLKLGSGPPDRA